MNKILENIYKNRSNYCHALEVSNKYELISCIESLYDEFIIEYTLDELIDFFNTMSIYCLDEEEEEVYNFDINNYLKEL